MPKIENGVHNKTMLAGLANAKAFKLEEINDRCEAALQGLTATYPDTERLTFDQQKQEAEARQADASAVCPLLAPLAEARGITLDDLAARVLGKAAAFSAASGTLIGQRQRMEDALEACASVEDVQAITVIYSLPGGAA